MTFLIKATSINKVKRGVLKRPFYYLHTPKRQYSLIELLLGR